EALQIIIPMLRDERPTFSGKHYTVENAINQPPPVGRIPVMIGGGGEKKTLRMVAQYADESNLTSPSHEIPRKLDALAAHCERLGRDRAEIAVSQHINVCINDTHEAAYADIQAFLGDRGLDLDAMDASMREQILAMLVWGDADEVGERITTMMKSGIDGITCS